MVTVNKEIWKAFLDKRAFHLEKEKSKQPGYVCTYDDLDFEYEAMSYGKLPAEKSKGYHLDPIPKEKSA